MGFPAEAINESCNPNTQQGEKMSMLDVAKYLSYSKSIDLPFERERHFNLNMANSGRLFSCLYSDRRREMPEQRRGKSY
jgi:hypothetical protein